MTRKQRAGAARHIKHKMQVVQEAGNIFHDIYDKVLKPTYEKVIKPGHDFIKRHKLISNVANLIPHPKAKAVGAIADKLGYGKRKRQSGAGKKRRSHRAILV